MPSIGPVIARVGAGSWEGVGTYAPVRPADPAPSSAVADSVEGAPSFTAYLKQAIDEVNALQIEADAATRAMLTGDISDIHQVTIATEKASLAMHMAIEIRNKVIEAYQEIMRMQV